MFCSVLVSCLGKESLCEGLVRSIRVPCTGWLNRRQSRIRFAGMDASMTTSQWAQKNLRENTVCTNAYAGHKGKRTRKTVDSSFSGKFKRCGGERERLPLKNGNWIQFALFFVDPVYRRRRNPFCKVREKNGEGGKTHFFSSRPPTGKKGALGDGPVDISETGMKGGKRIKYISIIPNQPTEAKADRGGLPLGKLCPTTADVQGQRGTASRMGEKKRSSMTKKFCAVSPILSIPIPVIFPLSFCNFACVYQYIVELAGHH